MSLTTREPSTKFFGPNRRYQPTENSNVRVLVQVHDLQPGQFWNPAFAAELHTPQVLVPFWPHPHYVFRSAHFLYVLHWARIRTELGVRLLPYQSWAFRFNPQFCVNRWCVNELTVPAGNYAFDGTATMSWFEV